MPHVDVAHLGREVSEGRQDFRDHALDVINVGRGLNRSVPTITKTTIREKLLLLWIFAKFNIGICLLMTKLQLRNHRENGLKRAKMVTKRPVFTGETGDKRI